MILSLHLLQYQISLIIVKIMFLHVKIKKVKFIKNLPTFAKLVYLFVLFLSYYILLRGWGCPWSYGWWISTTAYHSEVVSSNPTHGEVHLIQYCVIKFVSDLRQGGGFLWVLLFHSPVKLSATI